MNDSRHYNQFWQLTATHFLEIIREPGVLFWGIIFPILMSLGLGIAFTQKQDSTRKIAIIRANGITQADSVLVNCSVADSISRADSVAYTLSIKNDKLGNTTFLIYRMDTSEATLALKQGRINVIIDHEGAETVFRFDPRNPDAQLNYLKLAPFFGVKNTQSVEDASSFAR
jgi:hypothetical protein